MCVPVLEGSEKTLDSTWFEIPAHRVFHLKLLLFLVKFAPDNFLVDGIDNEIF